MGSVPQEKAGSAASLSATSGEFGVASGIAVFGSIGGAVYRSSISVPAAVPPGPAANARDTIVGVVSSVGALPAPLGAQLLLAARDAYNSALHVVAGISAVMFVALAVLALSALRHVGPAGAAAPAESEPEQESVDDHLGSSR
jgi:DHA2 family multidrug resistance protein-like MFS transporter